MSQITVDGHRLNVDIMEMLSDYEWHKATWKPGKLIAVSPFRDDHAPSFFVDLESGGWSDSGAIDLEWESGNLAKLLAFLRNETYEESLEYLVDTYGVRKLNAGDRIKLPSLNVKEEQPRIELPEDFLAPYKFRNPYLNNRGIPERVQRFMGVGYDRKSKAVVIPWRHPDGVLANAKYRRIDGKVFWYAKGASPIRDLVYGIHKVYAKGIRRVVVCEAEIDAMSWMASGVFAIALGGTTVTRKQLEIIRKSPVEEVILAMDNDGPGRKMGRKLKAGLRGYVKLTEVQLPADHKDANDALRAGVNLADLIG